MTQREKNSLTSHIRLSFFLMLAVKDDAFASNARKWRDLSLSDLVEYGIIVMYLILVGRW